MSDITISVIQPPSTTINVGVDETTLIQAGMGLPPHLVTHISGGSDELNHNLLAGLQGGSGGQYYHLSSGQYFNLITGSGAFYPNNNPSGFITGVDLTPYATVTYVTGVSGQLQAQITVLNNQTGSYVLNSETGQFYLNSNPSGFITGIDNIVYTTGDQIKSGRLIIGNDENSIVDPNSPYTLSIQTNSPRTWLEILNNSGVNQGVFFGIEGNDFEQYNWQGGDIKFFTSQNPSAGTQRLIIKNDGKVGIGTNSPSEKLEVVGNIKSNTAVFNTRPTVNGTGVLLEGEIPSTGYLSGYVNKNETGDFYPRTNPSGYITGINNLVFTTGNQTISGAKTFSNNLTVNGGDLFVDTSNNRVGINTTSPTATLDVNGSGIFRSGLFISGSRPTVNSTGILLSGEATTQAYVTGISGGLQTQITTLNNATGSYVLNSQTGVFYPRTNPSGYITGVDLSFSGNYYTKDESESRYVNTTGAETILGNKTFHDNVYINNLYVTGLETIVNTTNTNVASNYIMLNLTGGAVDGGLFFVTGSGLTGINDSGAIIGFDHSDKFKFGISTRASDLSTLNTIASVEQMTGISGGLQIQISTLNNQTGSYVLNTQTGQFYASSNPSGFITGIDLSSYATQVYVTGISGSLQTQITNLNNSTGQFYLNSNPSGYITGVDLSSYATQNYVTGISGELQSQINSLTGSSNTITIEDSNTIIGLSIFL